MKAPDVEQKIQIVQGRLETVRQHAGSPSPSPQYDLPAIIDEVSAFLEELHTVFEELYAQNQELMAAYQTLDVKWGQYQELFEVAPDAGFITDKLGVIRKANQAASALLNVEQRFLIGKPLVIFVAARDRLLFRKQLDRLADQQRLNDLKMQLQVRQGEAVCVVVSAFPLCDATTNVADFGWQMRPLGDRHFAEPQPTDLPVDQDLSELKSRFIRTMSHEFRTPLHVIQMAAHLLERYGHDLSQEQQQQCLQKIPSAVRSLTQMLERILTYAKTEAQSIPINPQCLNLHRFCQDIVQLHQSEASKQSHIEFRAIGNCEAVSLDPTLFQQILDNLLSNALKYSQPDSTVHLTLICEATQIIVQIRDEGVGIPVDDRTRLLEPFHRAKNVETIPGTGLGLAMVKQAVELYGGTIAIESQLNVGSTFTVTLPLQQIN